MMTKIRSQPKASPMSKPPHVIVVGAGIIGASIAWHLARQGAAVTIVAARTGGDATPASFAWINASSNNPEPYYKLRIRSITEWKRLAADVPALKPSWCGGIRWDMSRSKLDAYAHRHGQWGYGVVPLSSDDIRRLEPGIANPPDYAMHAVQEGAIEPEHAARTLLTDAGRRGAILVDAQVTGFLQTGERITGVATADGTYTGDHVVLAAGTGATALAATVGLELPTRSPAGLLVHSHPHARLLNGLVIAPGLHMRQTADGTIIAGADFGGSEPGEHAQATAAALFATLKSALVGAEGLSLSHYTLGHRPIPVDGFPVVGAATGHPGLYIALTHSGVTLAPVLGLFAAEEILHGQHEPLLASYRPARLI
jgi:glycine/D-amino acid oxidase-like deaminating enzyme